MPGEANLFCFLAYLLVCGVLLLILISLQQEGSAARTQGVAGAPAAGPEQTPPASAPVTNAGRAWEQMEEPPAAKAAGAPRTGPAWADHLEARLKAELDRAGSGDQELACARIRIDEPFADAKLPLVHAAIAQLLRGSFRLHDMIFETGNDSYTVLLPDTEVDAAVRQLEEFRVRCAGTTTEGRTRTVSIGVSTRAGRLLDAATLLAEADTALAKAGREGGNQVIGFRADPSRYRASVSGSVA